MRSFIDLTVCYRRKFRAFLCRNLQSQTPKGDICTCWPLNILSSDVTTPLIHSKRKTLFSTSKQRNKKEDKVCRVSLLLRRFVFRMAEASAKRVTGDELQGTMGRVPPSFAQTFSERRLGTRQSAGYRIGSLVTCARTHAAQCKNVYH